MSPDAISHEYRIIDAHVHCGRQDHPPSQEYDTIAAVHLAAGIDAACMFPPVAEVYDRSDPSFVDAPDWQARRRRADAYLLDLARTGRRPEVFPYYFVWNDFDLAALTDEHRGIKWHRHDNEPVYRYDDPACRALLDVITDRRLPIVLEEESTNTMRFLDELAPEAVVIIPHLGVLNGGWPRLHRERLWRRANVYADTSAWTSAQPGAGEALREFLATYGPEKLLFGSDYPFAAPSACLEVVLDLALPDADEQLVLAGNVMRLIRAAR